MDLLKLGMGVLVSLVGLGGLALAIPIVLTGYTVLPWPALPTPRGWRGGFSRGTHVSGAVRVACISNILLGTAALLIGAAFVPGLAAPVQRQLVGSALALGWAGLAIDVVAIAAALRGALRTRGPARP